MKNRVGRMTLRKGMYLLLTFIAVFGVCLKCGSIEAKAVTYDANKALSYAYNNYNVDPYKVKCAEFVSNCIQAGGIPKNVAWSASCTTLRRQLNNSGIGTEYTVTLSNGYVTKAACPNLSAGDVVFYYCPNHITGGSWSTHAVLSNGFDSSGKMKVYSHNNPQDGKEAVPYLKCGEDGCGKAFTTAHVYHFGNTVVQNSISFNSSSISLRSGDTVSVPFTFSGNGIISLSCGTSNGDVATARAIDCDWTTLKGTVTLEGTLTGGTTDGRTSLTVYFMDGNGNAFYQKSIDVIVPRRSNTIVFSSDTISVVPGEKKTVNFSFDGDGISYMMVQTDNDCIIATGSVDYLQKKGSIDVVGGSRSGKTAVSVVFYDQYNNAFYSKSFTANNSYNLDIKFDSSLSNVVREGEEAPIYYTVTGASANSVASVSYEIIDLFDTTNIIKGVRFTSSRPDSGTGRQGLVVRGLKQGRAGVKIHLYDSKGNEMMWGIAYVYVTERLRIEPSKSSTVLQMSGYEVIDVGFGGYGAEGILVRAKNTSIVDASFSYGKFSDGQGKLQLKGKNSGNTDVEIQLLDSSGIVLMSKSINVEVKNDVSVIFNRALNNIRVREGEDIIFTVYGDNVSYVKTSVTNESIVKKYTLEKNHNGKSNEYCVYVVGLVEGSCLFNVTAYDAYDNKLKEESCALFIREEAVIGTEIGYSLDKNTTIEVPVTFGGFDVRSVVAESKNTSMVTANLSYGQVSDRKGVLKLSGFITGNTVVTIKLLDYAGNTIQLKSVPVIVREKTDDRFRLDIDKSSAGNVKIQGITSGATYAGQQGFTIESEKPVVVAYKTNSSSGFKKLSMSQASGNQRHYSIAMSDDVRLFIAIAGDVMLDGSTSLKDATYIKQYLVGMRSMTPEQELAADVTGDGVVSLKDATFIKQYLVGMRSMSW